MLHCCNVNRQNSYASAYLVAKSNSIRGFVGPWVGPWVGLWVRPSRVSQKPQIQVNLSEFK